MNFLRLTALLGLTAVAAARASSEENAWPGPVKQIDEAGNVVSWQAAGPLLYRKPAEQSGTVSGFRPFYAQWTTPAGAIRETNLLYPIFTYRTDGETYRWSFFNFINRAGDNAGRTPTGSPASTTEAFDLWPFWFFRDTGSPADSYHALFPIAGTIKYRLGYDRLSWTLFPLYGRAEKNGATTTATPWPFLKITRGTEQGFALWPLFGTREKAGVFRRQFYLWPLGWNNTTQPAADAPPGTPPRRETGFLPLFTRETGPGFINENFLWPFFGYTDRTPPLRYHETRYLWPFLVQGHGDHRTVVRYGPFYTHSVAKGLDKKWVMWPLYREETWDDAGVAQTQRRFFYFVYQSTAQRSLANPRAATAERATLWPLYSAWDNGAGRRQFEFPSPLDVFFPDNERMRASWLPLFSLYRFDQSAPGFSHHELFWGLLSWRREPEHREFHLGPLLSVETRPAQERIALGNGLVGLRRSPARPGWRLFWFDFPTKANMVRPSSP